ncbi:hypothetical protein EVAR_17612_1 [Eumeta japonica]|uniref:Uncharacterized protein n=1 Tax=Eumeta variegata TaxID=151549 RepID=A0A4C1UDC5_EUMVA|nr:hypothetical protein EVAR_17612_1 [Eumeta japonica]
MYKRTAELAFVPGGSGGSDGAGSSRSMHRTTSVEAARAAGGGRISGLRFTASRDRCRFKNHSSDACEPKGHSLVIIIVACRSTARYVANDAVVVRNDISTLTKRCRTPLGDIHC